MGRKRTKTQASDDTDSDDEGTSKRSRIAEDKENVTSNAESAVMNLQPSRRVITMKDLEGRMEANLKSGKIKKIYLQNFMCHGNFEVNLNKCINIIVGLNGSGKSAILTAIAIGLGGKASSTARSTNLKELVKIGESSAVIEITLTNDGVDAYEQDVFGDEIIVVRTINANSGASTYKLKNKYGKVISTTRQDLVKMSLCLNIQVENPVLILNQDAARSFLKECDPKKLYQFFMKATQIEAIIDKLNSCFQTALSSKNHLANIENAIKKNESDIEKIRQKHSRLQSVKELKKRIEDYKNEIAWIHVTEAERELEANSAELTLKHDEVCKISDLITNKGKYEKEGREKIRELGTQFAQLQYETENNSVTYDKSRKEYEAERDKLSEFENSTKNYSERLTKKVVPNIRQLQQDIAEHESNPDSVENQRLANEAKILVLEKKIAETAAVQSNYTRDYQMFLQTLNEERQNTEEIKEKINREQNNIAKINQQILQYKNAGKDTLSIYGSSMSRLLRDLDTLHKQNKFTELPRGPFGKYIEVPNPKYRKAVETILRTILPSFVVNCDKDRLLLTNVLQRYNDIRNVQIITTEFVKKVYDVSKGLVKLQTRGAILFNVIKVSDPVVLNCLIDSRKIERIVLVENTDSAIELTQDERSVPKNLSRVMCLNPLSEYFPAPNYRSYSIREQPLRYIQPNFNDLIEDAENQKVNFEQKHEEFKNRLHENNAKIKEFDKYVKEKHRLISEVKRKEMNLSRDLNELKSIEYPENTDIEFLKNNLEEEKKIKELLEKKIEETKEKLEERKNVVERFKAVMDQHLTLSRQSREKMRHIQSQMESVQNNLNKMKSDMETKGRQIKNLQDEEKVISLKVNELTRKVQELTANTKGDRVLSYRSVDGLTMEIRKTERRIETIQSSNERIEDVATLLSNKIQQLENTKEICVALDKVLKKLTNLRESRYVYVRKLRQHMSMKIKHKFYQLMSLRNYTAEIIIDHKEQKLHLKIIPRDSEIEGAVSNTKSLSGGERSYSTVSFLLSLWSCVDHPFYFLDEYDVFSDEYNRHMMTKLLLNEAEKKKDKQFGFLTPQEFSDIKASDFTTIHKLQDPERRN